MASSESIKEYYERTSRTLPPELALTDTATFHFNVLKRGNCYTSLSFTRRDYYKICLSKGSAELFTENGIVTIDRPAIFFSDTHLRYGWQNVSEEQEGYVCLFNELYTTPDLRHVFLKFTNLFGPNCYPFLFLDDDDYNHFSSYFNQLIDEHRSRFALKDEMIRNMLKLITYSAIKRKYASLETTFNAASGDLVATRFLNLLDSQFPIDSPAEMLPMKSPADFADTLGIHVNHLNHCVKLTMGRTTTELIHERLYKEATELLLHTEWPIAAIGYSLGFAYPQHFNAFIRKYSDQSPKAIRRLASHI